MKIFITDSDGNRVPVNLIQSTPRKSLHVYNVSPEDSGNDTEMELTEILPVPAAKRIGMGSKWEALVRITVRVMGRVGEMNATIKDGAMDQARDAREAASIALFMLRQLKDEIVPKYRAEIMAGRVPSMSDAEYATARGTPSGDIPDPADPDTGATGPRIILPGHGNNGRNTKPPPTE